MMIYPWYGRTALVTGASSGIGRGLSVALGAQGSSLVLCARNKQELERTAETARAAGAPDVEVATIDLSDAEERRRLFHRLVRRDPPVELVFANAGVSQRSAALDTARAVERQLWEVNYHSVVDAVRAFIPAMIERGRGWFAAVSSISAYVGAPWRSTYGATKAALGAYVATLANELHRTPVSVHLVVPGFVRTGVSMAALHADGTVHGKMDRNMEHGLDPATASKRILSGIARGKRRVFVGMTPATRLMVRLSGVAPGIVDPMLRRADLGAP
jgi:short-subunit dehydrogenase